MALTGLDIFKLLPKTNCKKCGKPTCLAFAMALAQKRAKLEECPDVSDEAKEKLAAAAAPPMLKVQFGTGDNQVTLGQETVCFRHEEKFHSPTVIGVTVSDKLSGSAETFAKTAEAVKKECDHALILVTKSPDAMAAAAKKVKDGVPLLAQATPENVAEMSKVAKENDCPLVAAADSLEALADLTEKIKAEGVENIVLCPPGGATGQMKELLNSLSGTRVLALKKVFRPLGYPTISFVTGVDDDTQMASAASLICKYSGVVVVNTVEPYAILPMLTVVMNIYTDPQKPVQVEPKVYSIGEPDENSPVMFTTNFSLTYYTVESDVEASRVPSYILVVDTEGTSVLTAYSGDKLNEKTVADAMAKYGVESLVKHRKLIIPGYVAVMSGKLEEATNWEVMVGPRECSMLPKYLQEVWN